MDVINSRLAVVTATSHPHLHTSNFSNGIGWVLQVLFREKVPDTRGCRRSVEKYLLERTGIQFSCSPRRDGLSKLRPETAAEILP